MTELGMAYRVCNKTFGYSANQKIHTMATALPSFPENPVDHPSENLD
jgi:hypothetical protein